MPIVVVTILLLFVTIFLLLEMDVIHNITDHIKDTLQKQITANQQMIMYVSFHCGSLIFKIEKR